MLNQSRPALTVVPVAPEPEPQPEAFPVEAVPSADADGPDPEWLALCAERERLAAPYQKVLALENAHLVAIGELNVAEAAARDFDNRAREAIEAWLASDAQDDPPIADPAERAAFADRAANAARVVAVAKMAVEDSAPVRQRAKAALNEIGCRITAYIADKFVAEQLAEVLSFEADFVALEERFNRLWGARLVIQQRADVATDLETQKIWGAASSRLVLPKQMAIRSDLARATVFERQFATALNNGDSQHAAR